MVMHINTLSHIMHTCSTGAFLHHIASILSFSIVFKHCASRMDNFLIYNSIFCNLPIKNTGQVTERVSELRPSC